MAGKNDIGESLDLPAQGSKGGVFLEARCAVGTTTGDGY
jgi:hypothetical protein